MGTLIRNTQGHECWSHSHPPSTGPTTGASNVVMAHSPIACIDWRLGKIRSSSVCDSAMSGPPAIPCSTRIPSNMGNDVDKPHGAEAAGEPPRERHRDRLGNGIRGDDPRALARARTEGAGNVGHG